MRHVQLWSELPAQLFFPPIALRACREGRWLPVSCACVFSHASFPMRALVFGGTQVRVQRRRLLKGFRVKWWQWCRRDPSIEMCGATPPCTLADWCGETSSRGGGPLVLIKWKFLKDVTWRSHLDETAWGDWTQLGGKKLQIPTFKRQEKSKCSIWWAGYQRGRCVICSSSFSWVEIKLQIEKWELWLNLVHLASLPLIGFWPCARLRIKNWQIEYCMHDLFCFFDKWQNCYSLYYHLKPLIKRQNTFFPMHDLKYFWKVAS